MVLEGVGRGFSGVLEWMGRDFSGVLGKGDPTHTRQRTFRLTLILFLIVVFPIDRACAFVLDSVRIRRKIALHCTRESTFQ